ncbi:MAG: cpsB [Deltaproteobacteria bacterium]|nr:cpsB [Deltaproteobacteria bacterium]
MKAIILAGGSGTRLWPLSRADYPKQFLKISGMPSLFQQTVQRLLGAVAPEDIVILTNADYQFHVRSDLLQLFGDPPPPSVVLEPCSRNTAPALALAAAFCLDRMRARLDEVLFIAPSDHVLDPPERFVQYLRRAQEIAGAGYVVTFGVTPRTPETGYGYIKTRAIPGCDYRAVEGFTEKPDPQTAQDYLRSGDYYWNSGMFAFQIGVLLDEFQRHAPAIFSGVQRGYEAALAEFAEMPNISIDYAVMERSDRLVTLPLDLDWNDVGSWDALVTLLARDEHGNMTLGDVLALDTRDSLILSEKRLIATIGLSDLLVVETGDALLIARRGAAQQVKHVVERLKQASRREADEHVTTYRPWGHYTVLERGERYVIKRLVVQPGERMSLQMHQHRSEHWVVVRGTALVKLGEVERLVHENESAYVPPTMHHRIANPGPGPLEIIEVQNGDYIGEDDIVRFDDAYGRALTNER